MRLHTLPLAFLLGCSSIVACGGSADPDDVADNEDELVQFPAAVLNAASTLAYGATSAPIVVPSRGWAAVKLVGTAGDELAATVKAQSPDRGARIYLAEKRGTKYVSVLSGTNADDHVIRANLASSKEYWIVFREAKLRAAAFTVTLTKIAAPPAACGGAPLVTKGIVDRTPQGEEPFLEVTGVYTDSVRTCNVATGCSDPEVTTQNDAHLKLVRDPNGSWRVETVTGRLDHDGTTGALTGGTTIVAKTGRSVEVGLRGHATTSCITYGGTGRYDVDEVTYVDVAISFQATTPPVAPRTPVPTTPPVPPCANELLASDEEVLSRFPRAASTANLGETAQIQYDVQYCHPETGCLPWERSTGPYASVTGHVLGPSQVGLSFSYTGIGDQGSTEIARLDDGVFRLTNAFLQKSGEAVGRVSATTIYVAEKTASPISGNGKIRRFACIPLVAQP